MDKNINQGVYDRKKQSRNKIEASSNNDSNESDDKDVEIKYSEDGRVNDFENFRMLFSKLKDETNNSTSTKIRQKYNVPARRLLPYYTEKAVINKKSKNNEKKPSPVSMKRSKKVSKYVPCESVVKIIEKEIANSTNYTKNVKSYNDFDDSIFENHKTKTGWGCPYSECGKEFPSLGRAKRHLITHTKHKPHKCINNLCEQVFSRKDNMLQHSRNHCRFNNSNSNP